MDVDYWESRVHPVKQLVNVNDSEGDDDTRAFFPCPYCYVEVQVNLLRIHLQNDHCFDLRNAVCPLCAANIEKDVTGHFISLHTNLLKRRRSHKACLWTDGSPSLERQLWRSNSDHSPDPLISPFLCSTTFPETEEIQQDNVARVHSKRSAPSSESRRQDYKTRRQRSEFIQELISSTIF